jgi:dihydrofolate synthase/folylpolyglutamate synthase
VLITSAPGVVRTGAMRDKNLEEMAELLFPVAANLVLTQPDNPRAATVETLKTIAGELGIKNVTVTRSVAEGVAKANEVTSPSGLICVTGSLYLLGEVKAILNSKVNTQQ